MTRKEYAVQTFQKGYNCAQSVFSTFADSCGVTEEQATILATGFGGGVARHGELCGALSGGVMALSARFGRAPGESKEKMEDVYRRTQELFQQFEKKMGDVNCKTLLDGCNLLSEKGQCDFVELGYGHTVCIPCVETTVELLESLMDLQKM